MKRKIQRKLLVEVKKPPRSRFLTQSNRRVFLTTHTVLANSSNQPKKNLVWGCKTQRLKYWQNEGYVFDMQMEPFRPIYLLSPITHCRPTIAWPIGSTRIAPSLTQSTLSLVVYRTYIHSVLSLAREQHLESSILIKLWRYIITTTIHNNREFRKERSRWPKDIY